MIRANMPRGNSAARTHREEVGPMKMRAVFLAVLIVGVMFASMGVSVEAARSDDACEGKNKKNCEVPEVPWTLVLPVASVGIAATYYLVQRRRFREEPAAEQQ